MASRIGFAALALLLAVAVPAMAANFDVGDSGGWTNSGGYDSWVSGKPFSAGDTLTFTYDSTHSVVRVGNKDEYDGCNTNNALKTDSTSPTTVTLDKAGTTYYFVCGTISHCMTGMKLSLTTTGGGGSTPSTPTTPATPSSPSTPTATPSTPSATPSTPTTTTSGPKSAAPAATVTGTAAAAVAGVLAAALLG